MQLDKVTADITGEPSPTKTTSEAGEFGFRRPPYARSHSLIDVVDSWGAPRPFAALSHYMGQETSPVRHR